MAGLEQINITAQLPSQTIELRANTANQIALTATALPSGPRGEAGGPDASAIEKGILKLAGDLGGSANSPTTPTAVHVTGDESIDGTKTFLDAPVVPTPSSNSHAASKEYVDSAGSAGLTTNLTTTMTSLMAMIPSTLGTGTDQNYRAPTDTEVRNVLKGLQFIAAEAGKAYSNIDLTNASAALTPYGFTVTKGYDSVSFRPYVLAQSEATYPSSSNYRAWGNYFFDMSQPISMVIEAPHPQTDGNSEVIALREWQKTPGALYIMSSVNRKAKDYMVTEISTDHTGGTYTLNVLGLGTTTTIAPDASIATIQSAVEGVVGVGNVVVTGDPADTSLHAFVNLNPSLYNSGSPTNTITVGTNSLTGGTYITLDHDADVAHNYNSIFNKAVELFATQGYAQLQMHGFSDVSSGVPRIFSAILSRGSSNNTKLIEVVRTSLESQGFDVAVKDSYSTQGLYVTGSPTSGSLVLRYNSINTGSITYSTTPATFASNVQTALEAHASIGTGNVAVTISQNTNTGVSQALVITFKNRLYHGGEGAITVNSQSFTGGTSPIASGLTAEGTALTAQSNTQGDIAEIAGTIFMHLELSATVRNSSTLSARVVDALANTNLPQLSAAAMPVLAESGHDVSQAPLVNGSGATIGTSNVAARADHRHPMTGNTPSAGDYVRRSDANASWTAVSSSQLRTDLAPRVVTLADSATITPSSSTTDVAVIALVASRTIGAPSGTPTGGQLLTIRIKYGGAFTPTWNAIYRFAGGVTPTATATSTKTDYFQFMYNAVDSKWDCINNQLNY